MLKSTISFFLFFVITTAHAQPNCNVFLQNGDTLQYKACTMSENIDAQHYQFSKEFQQKYDEVLRICPYFGDAYAEKAVAYLKSGDFVTWKKWIDKAVLYSEKDYLGYRGACRYEFFHDYKGAIQDIEHLDSLTTYNLGYNAAGEYHLNIIKAICYSALNQKQKAIDIFENQLQTKDYSAGLFDYYQLGVTYFQIKDYTNALRCFERQAETNNLAENEYYKAFIFKIQNKENEYKNHKTIALKLYNENKILFDFYVHHYNKVYLQNITEL